MGFFDGIIDTIKEAVGGVAENVNVDEITSNVQDAAGDATQQVGDAADQASQTAQDAVENITGSGDEK